MPWRGATSRQERILACLPYLLPLLHCYPFGLFLFSQFPPLHWLFVPITWLMPIYYSGGPGIAIVPLLVFIVLFVTVVRNPRIRHLIRYNTMQALMIGFALALILSLLELLNIVNTALIAPTLSEPSPDVGGLFFILLFDVLFLGTLALVVFSVVQSLRGHHAEIPIISNAVYAQTRD
ncbi:MAG: hypothetical protein HC940_08595 [Acaryochloris sp. SU_5_25]|nr:hypothetical protein [Acaryochloris sp. SU_5_25]